MKASSISALLVGMLTLGASGSAQAQIAKAAILEDVVIDGKLNDWPEDMERYPIRNYYQSYGPTDIDHADLNTSADLSPHFRVAYSPDENLVYVAVEVRDEEHVVGNHYMDTDAVEIFTHGEGRRSKGEPFQYVLVPGRGQYAGGWRNPGLKDRDITRTRTRAAYSRNGDVTIYEWAVEVFDQFPNRPTTLTPGKTIGFDVVAVDKDGYDTPAQVPWGPPMTEKYYHPDRLGTLALLDESGSWAAVAVNIPEADMGQFEKDMARFGEEMAKFGVEMAALGLEKAARELEKANLPDGELAQARRDLEEARRELERELRIKIPVPTPAPVVVAAPVPPAPPLPHRLGRNISEKVIEDIVEALKAAFILLCIAFSIGLVAYMVRKGRRPAMDAESLDELAAHLETIEQRLTDTQEVMIALSEKYDRLEDKYQGSDGDKH